MNEWPKLIIEVLLVWFAFSVPCGIVVGKVIRGRQ